ncbi:hypothetical protein Tco_0884594 [Tanacetum coccineum]
MDQVESVKTSKALKEIFLEFKDVSRDFIPNERCVWIDLVGLPLASWAPEVYKKLGGRWGSSVFSGMFGYWTAPNIESCKVNSSLIPQWEWKDAEEEGVIRDDSVLYNVWVYLRIAWKGIWKMMSGMLRQVIAPGKKGTPSLRIHLHSTGGNDLNIAVGVGSSWIDYMVL